MADEKSIYERWSEERLDPPLPKEWGLNEEDEAELLWPIRYRPVRRNHHR